MAVPRLYVEAALLPGADLELPQAPAHHVRTVLRLARDAEVILFDGRGGEYAARLTVVARDAVRVKLGAHLPGIAEPALALTLVQAISRGERMDYTLQKAVELGVARIVPVASTRSVVRLDAAREDKRVQHWRGVVRHAAEQCGRTRVPDLAPVLKLAEWASRPGPGAHYLLAPGAADSLAGLAMPAGPVTLLAGPEGGFAPEEMARLLEAGARAVRLGPRILRTETAALVALAVMQAQWGDLQ